MDGASIAAAAAPSTATGHDGKEAGSPGRVRDVAADPDSAPLVLTDSDDGAFLRVAPAGQAVLPLLDLPPGCDTGRP